MKRWLTTAALWLALTGVAHAISVDNVISMHQSGLPPDVIMQTLKSTNSSFNLTTDDLAKLEKAGVPKQVIEAMMTAGGSGDVAPAPEPAPEPEVDPLEKMRQEEEDAKAKTEEQLRLEAARQRAEEEEKRRIEAERKRRISLALGAAKEAFEDGNYRKAAQLYDEFLQSQEDPAKPSARQAALGLADSLFRLGLYGNAAEIYQTLLGYGPETDVFEPAFMGLRKATKEISYNPVTLESLTAHFVGGFDQKFQDAYNYFLGKFFFDYNRYEEARTYLPEVSEGSEDYAGAQYLQGLMIVMEADEEAVEEDKYKTLIGASGNFEGAARAGLARGDERIAHLSYLALGRIAYTIGINDVAIYYYRKVPTTSTNYVDALYESAWSYFLKGDISRGMGLFHTLDGPDWESYFLPDTHLLEAAAFMNTCHFDYAYDAINRIEKKYLALSKPIQNYLAEYAEPEALYEAFVEGKVRRGVDLPRLVRLAVISNVEFYDRYTTVISLRDEVAAIKAGYGDFGGDLAGRLLETVEGQAKEGRIALGIKINQLLQALDGQMTDLEVQAAEIRIEIDELAATELAEDIESDYQGTEDEQAAQDAVAAERAASVFIGNQYLRWPFEGEYWADEVNSYRSELNDRCAKK
ncbi:MAG: tetratricopeptide repeat protein [Bradymonadia bacterium]